MRNMCIIFFSIVSLPWIVELGVLFFFGISWVMLSMLIGLSECWKVRFGRWKWYLKAIYLCLMWRIWRQRKVGEYLREETTLMDVLLRSIQERTKAMIPSPSSFSIF